MSIRNIMGPDTAQAIGVTPTTFNALARGVYLGTGGDVTFTLESGDTVQFKNMAGGMMHPIRYSAITAVANGAADIVALF